MNLTKATNIQLSSTHPNADETEYHGHDVGQHVVGVTDQGQGLGYVPEDDLYEEECYGEDEGYDEFDDLLLLLSCHLPWLIS